MFFQECEHLASENPRLARTIRKIDELLHSAGPSGFLRPEEVVSKLRERRSHVTGVLNTLSQVGLLREERYLECPQCDNLVVPEEYDKAIEDQDVFECSQCETDLIFHPPAEVRIYRLNPNRIEVPKHQKEAPSSMATLFTDEFHEGLPQKVLEDPFINTPLLRYYSRDPDLSRKRPFEGKRVFFVLHFLRDLIPFVQATIALGLDVKSAGFFYKEYPYPQRESIRRWLEEQGAIVQPRSYIHQCLTQLVEGPPDRIGEIVIVEDGGFFVPAIHMEFSQLIPHVIGAVEQTTRGIRNAEKLREREFPIISVATCRLKSDFEPPYIARAVVNNIGQLLPNLALNGRSVALYGCGTIGKQIAEWLRRNDARVMVFEPSAERRLWAQQNGYDLADSPEQAARNKDFVIGSSGSESINSQVIANLSHGTYLVSASSEQYEIDMVELSRRAAQQTVLTNQNGREIGTTFVLSPNNKQIHVLANGYPINFWGFESMPEEASDLVLTLILLGAAKVALGSYSTPGVNAEAVNQLAQEYQVAQKFLEFHQQR